MNIEAGIITRREYETLEDKRIDELDLAEDGLLIGMFDLRRNTQNWEALKWPVKIMDVDIAVTEACIACIGILNLDLETVFNTYVGNIQDGYWQDVEKQPIFRGLAIRRSYLREPSPGRDDDILSGSRGLLLAA